MFHLNQSTLSIVLLFFPAAFKMIEGDQAPLQKFVYLIGNFLSLGLAIYKCQGMGLLPTTTSDWLAFVEPQRVSSNSGLQSRKLFFLFLNQNTCCGYSKEPSLFEHPKHF